MSWIDDINKKLEQRRQEIKEYREENPNWQSSANGTHTLTKRNSNKEFQDEVHKKLIENNPNHYSDMGNKGKWVLDEYREANAKRNSERLKNRSKKEVKEHNKMASDIAMKRGSHPSQLKRECPICGRSIQGAGPHARHIKKHGVMDKTYNDIKSFIPNDWFKLGDIIDNMKAMGYKPHNFTTLFEFYPNLFSRKQVGTYYYYKKNK